jgi:hypothetical protein
MNWVDLLQFKSECELAGLTVPTPITRGPEMIELAKEQETPPSGSLLALSNAELVDRITEMSIREHQGHTAASRGMAAGVETFTSEMLAEVRSASIPELERLITELQPRFDELAAPLVTAAQKYGYTLQTTSYSVINLADEEASKAWRDARSAWHAILPIVRLRIRISEAFNLSPTLDETNQMFFTAGIFDLAVMASNKPDYSVCFAAGDNWSYDGAYAVSKKNGSGIDWFALAAGGLALNTPAQVREKQDRKAVSAPRVQEVEAEEVLTSSSLAVALPRYPKA